MQTTECKERAKSVFIYSLIFLSCFILFGSSLVILRAQNKVSLLKHYTIRINGTDIDAEVAKTSEDRVLGLSGRLSLDENQGMFFVFDDTGNHGIWMKDMNYPLDIAWITKEFKIVSIERNVSPQTWPKILKPKVSAMYVLEVNANWFDRHNVKVGEYISFVDK